MSHKLIDHSSDLNQLRNEGYEIEIKGGYLLAHHIPYVNTAREIKFGTLVSELTLSTDKRTTTPGTHVIFFIGEHPCHNDGRIISQIKHSSEAQTLHPEVTVQQSFSNKPKNGYLDYYQKIDNYAEIISAPAKSIDINVTAKTFRVVKNVDEEDVFQYMDSNSSRANVNQITQKLKGNKISIIGLGGTGVYILDFIAKTPVQEIHLFDGDFFLQHNAFRSPGAASIETLDRHMKKVLHWAALYSNMHKHIVAHDYYLTEERLSELKGMSYVFIAVDQGKIKKSIMEYLLKINIPFIDVGMGVNKVNDFLVGTLRVTTGTGQKNDHLSSRISTAENENDEYNTNIQIAELNALNAALAVIKWKKLCGFYNDLEEEHHTTYCINVSQLLNEDVAA
jgi:hypothetical protein